MAYRPQVNDVLEVRIVVFDPSPPTQIGLNVLHYVVSGITAVGVYQGDIAVTLDAAFAAPMKALLANPVTYRGVMVQKIWPLPRKVAEFTVVSAGAGLGGAVQAPTQTCGLIKLGTANAGRPFRGRIYIPFPSSSVLTAGGNASAGYFTALQTLANTLVTPRTTNDGTNTTSYYPAIYHAKAFGNPPSGAHTFDTTTTAVPSPLWATQRRRGNYGRSNASSPI